ncbi:MAG: septal ring lytic transglycosylase RlpA family protein [Treponema sp.]|jgi:rare lipoprotein A|nr:septal ring lytic transglycosylase RlpA family protein [Treponema sp.]
MKKIFFSFLFFVTVFIIPYYAQAQVADIFRQEGIASWYGREFDGRPTASGEIFDATKLTAAHPSLPFGTMIVVTNHHNNKKVTVRVNDRGPFVAARIIDISMAAAEQLDMIVTGTAPVTIESIERIVMPSPVTETVKLPSVAETPTVTVNQPVSTAVFASQPVVTYPPQQIRITPAINIVPNKTYRLQLGSYKVARNAIDTFDRLKNSGFNPAYERYIDSNNGEYFRVVLAGIRGTDVQLTAEKLGAAGFSEALIREEK